MKFQIFAIALLFVLAACDSTETNGDEGRVIGDGSGSCDISGETIDDDLTIQRDATCTLTNVTINGNVFMRRGSMLTASGIVVDGNIQAEGALSLAVSSDSRIESDIQFEDGGDVDVRDTYIGGNLQLEDNVGTLTARNNTIGGNLQAFDNGGGPFTYSDNVIDGNLQCTGNNPAPSGEGNVVDGNKEDQCSGL